MTIKTCPGTLAQGYNSYSNLCLRKLFSGKKVSHVLPYNSPKTSDDNAAIFIENRKRISISGVQEKMSLLLDKNKLRLTKEGELGTYMLKPIPVDLKKVSQVPANEHLTMQIARQVYAINTAENALIFFKTGEPAYITKRFDVKQDGTKWGKEDFATLAGKTTENAGANFKYDYSYEALVELLKRYVPSYVIEIEKLFNLIVFNYLFSNGDAHVKNFSLLETENGDYTLSPAYDLINTRIHVDDSDFALSKGLFKDNYISNEKAKSGKPGKQDFIEFARRAGIEKEKAENLLAPFLENQEGVARLIENSYLDEPTKRAYLIDYQNRRNQLNII
jgi:serine/threonine-protein kinase HipA